MKVLVVGVPRQSDVVITSIQKNILIPNGLSDYDVSVFLNRIERFHQGRSGDGGTLSHGNYQRYIDTFSTSVFDNDSHGLDTSVPDCYADGYVSLSNLYAYLNLLHQASGTIYDNEPMLLIRPDTKILDVLPLRAKLLKLGFVILPAWQDWGCGFNDRFIMAAGNQMKRVMRRRDLIPEFISSRKPLKSESLMRYSLRNTPVLFTGARVQRLRNDEANVVSECFRPNYLKCYAKMMLNFL